MSDDAKDAMNRDDKTKSQSTSRKIVRNAVKLLWVVPAVIAAIELADQEVRAAQKPRKVSPR